MRAQHNSLLAFRKSLVESQITSRCAYSHFQPLLFPAFGLGAISTTRAKLFVRSEIMKSTTSDFALVSAAGLFPDRNFACAVDGLEKREI